MQPTGSFVEVKGLIVPLCARLCLRARGTLRAQGSAHGVIFLSLEAGTCLKLSSSVTPLPAYRTPGFQWLSFVSSCVCLLQSKREVLLLIQASCKSGGSPMYVTGSICPVGGPSSLSWTAPFYSWLLLRWLRGLMSHMECLQPKGQSRPWLPLQTVLSRQ